MRSRMIITGTLAAVFGSVGCSSDLQQQASLLNKENEELRQQLAGRNTALTESQDELRARNMQLAELRRNLENEPPAPPPAMVTGFEQIDDISASYGSGEIVVAVRSDVLFAPGKTTLKSRAKVSLDDVAGVLNRSYSDQLIRIEGHTDSDPIRKSGFASNYHLGFQRAYAVRKYLISRGLEPGRVSVASFGPDQPRASKSDSRRVEIVVMMNP